MRAALSGLWPVAGRWTVATAPQQASGRRHAGTVAPSLAAFVWTLIVVCLFVLVSVLGNAVAEDGIPPGLAAMGRYAPYFVKHYCLMLLPAALFAGVADRMPFRGARRTAALIAALATGAACTGVFMTYLEGCVFECLAPGTAAWVREAVEQTVYAMSFTSAVAVVHFSRRRDKALAAALHDSELARIDGERQHLGARLTAMQARVEPSFLLAALRDVGVLFERDRADGMRMLELLNRYLRTALPRMRDTNSSVGREVDLAGSYLAIAALRTRGALAIECTVEPQAEHAHLAPMLLLPLVAAAGQGDDAAGTVSVRARCTDAHLDIAVDAQGSMATRMAGCPAIDEVRARLAAIHGARATLTVERSAPDACRIHVQVAHEPAHRDRR